MFVCQTSKGEIEIKLEREWSPLGAARFEELVDAGFFKDLPLFRCVDKFLCQFGYKREGDTRHFPTIADDVPNTSTPRKFKRGYLSFAGGGRNSRDQHFFITLGENVSSLGQESWETPIGYVTEESMARVVSKFETSYGDMPPWGKGPDAGKIAGDDAELSYLRGEFPRLDYLHSCARKTREAQSNLIEFELGPKLGKVVVELFPEWAPLGVERVRQLIAAQFLDQARFFRVVPNFIVQFGMPADPVRAKEFPQFKDDAVLASNLRGTMTFAMAGPNTRSFQLFINLKDNARLDGMKFAPLGRVVEGMEWVDQINAEYGERPDQGKIAQRGNAYLDKEFPRLSYIQTARIAHEAVQEPNGFSALALVKPHASWFELGFSLLVVGLVLCAFALAVKRLFAPQPIAAARRKHIV